MSKAIDLGEGVTTCPIMATTAIGNKRQLANPWNVKRELVVKCH